MVKSVNENEMGSTDESMTSASSPEGSVYQQQQFFHQNSQHLQQQHYFQMQQHHLQLRQQQQQQQLHYQQQEQLRQYQVQHEQQHYVQQVYHEPPQPGYHSRSRSGHGGDRRPRCSQKLLLPPPPSTSTATTTTTSSSYPQSPTSPELDPTATLNGHPFQLPNLGPDQTYIISGPFNVNGQYTMMVYPIPKGATVFATPSVKGDLSPPMNTFPAIRSPAPVVQSESQLEFSTPIPVQDPTHPSQAPSLPKSNFRPPCALIWNRHSCPEGRIMPLRQSQPPVYFYQASEEGVGNPQQHHPESVA